jgi:hypothetical protein
MAPMTLLSLLLILIPFGGLTTLAGQSPDLCAALLSAHRNNQVVRVSLVRDETVTGRLPTQSCSAPLAIGGRRVLLEDVEQLEIRIRDSDSVVNGIVIGGLAAGAALGLVAPVMTGGDAPFMNGFLAGAPVGALVGLLIDAARERPARWSVAWKAR